MRLNDVLTQRFGEGYERAKSLSRVGLVISRTSIVLTVPAFLMGLEMAGHSRMLEVIMVWSMSGLVALIGYAIGKVVTVQSEALKAAIDVAVNSSSSLSEQNRLEILTVPSSDSWRPFGIGLAAQTESALVQPVTIAEEPTATHSPIAALIANNPLSPQSYFAPVWRSERHLARPVRRR